MKTEQHVTEQERRTLRARGFGGVESAPTRSEHTRKPLLVHVTDGGAVYITDDHRFSDATTLIRIDNPTQPNPKAAAEFIVHAANVYDREQQTIRELLELLQEVSHDINNPYHPLKVTKDVPKRIEAAIKKAKGEHQ